VLCDGNAAGTGIPRPFSLSYWKGDGNIGDENGRGTPVPALLHFAGLRGGGALGALGGEPPSVVDPVRCRGWLLSSRGR